MDFKTAKRKEKQFQKILNIEQSTFPSHLRSDNSCFQCECFKVPQVRCFQVQCAIPKLSGFGVQTTVNATFSSFQLSDWSETGQHFFPPFHFLRTHNWNSNLVQHPSQSTSKLSHTSLTPRNLAFIQR